MSKLRSEKWRCVQQLNPDGERCGEIATYRCNHCKETYCDECWLSHLEMTVEADSQQGKGLGEE